MARHWKLCSVIKMKCFLVFLALLSSNAFVCKNSSSFATSAEFDSDIQLSDDAEPIKNSMMEYKDGYVSSVNSSYQTIPVVVYDVLTKKVTEKDISYPTSGYNMAGCYNYACGYPVENKSDSRYAQLCYSPAYEKYYTDTVAPKDSDMFSLNNYVLGGMSGGPVLFYYENNMTFEQYDGVSSIITRGNKSNGHGYSVKVTNKMIETLKEASRL